MEASPALCIPEWPTGPTWGTQWVSLTFAKMSWSCQTKGEERAAGRDRPTEIHPLKRLRFNERNELKQITEVQQSSGVDTRDEPESPQHSRDGSRRTGQEQGRHSRTGLRQNLTQGKKHPQGRSASRPQSRKHLGSLRSRQAGAWKPLPAAPAAVAHISPTRGADRLRRRKDGGVICLSCSLSLCLLGIVTPTFIEFNIDEPLPH